MFRQGREEDLRRPRVLHRRRAFTWEMGQGQVLQVELMALLVAPSPPSQTQDLCSAKRGVGGWKKAQGVWAGAHRQEDLQRSRVLHGLRASSWRGPGLRACAGELGAGPEDQKPSPFPPIHSTSTHLLNPHIPHPRNRLSPLPQQPPPLSDRLPLRWPQPS